MAPSPIVEDYYKILEVEQTATADSITSSYRRLAKILHPDRNSRPDATEAFQRLGRAYETLKDESERRAYDTYTYPSLVRTSSQNASPQAWRSAAASTPSSSEASTEATQIASIQKLKQERSVRWQTKKTTFDKTISELRRGIEQLEQEIKNLDSIRAAEVAAEAQKNSWRTWLLSPLYKKAEESEEEKARKDRGRQERRLEKDMKERRLTSKRLDLKNEQTRLKEAKDEIDAADKCDEEKIRMIHARKWAREAREIFEREAKLRRQQQAQQAERRAREDRERQERMERLRREQQEQEKKERAAAEKRAAEQRRYAEATRRQEQQLRENIFQSVAQSARGAMKVGVICWNAQAVGSRRVRVVKLESGVVVEPERQDFIANYNGFL